MFLGDTFFIYPSVCWSIVQYKAYTGEAVCSLVQGNAVWLAGITNTVHAGVLEYSPRSSPVLWQKFPVCGNASPKSLFPHGQKYHTTIQRQQEKKATSCSREAN